jgi:hypothetical protein
VTTFATEEKIAEHGNIVVARDGFLAARASGARRDERLPNR